jgi:hypothetical protein
MGVTIPSAAGEVLEQYEISNSLRFNDDDDARLSRSVSGNLSKAHTFALWIKRGNLKASGRHVLAAMGDGSGDISWLELNNDRIAMLFDGAGNYFPKTDAVLRDPSAWYHIVITVDSAQGTASNRCKFYLNGTQLTDTSGTNPPQDHQAAMDACVIGYNSSDEFDGYMAEFHFLDGVAYDPTYFGRFDANGVWVPKKYTGGNYGTNGFYFEFKQTGTSANSSGIGADTSGNDSHFTVTNLAATDVTEDTCTNNFATLNSIDGSLGSATLADGNTDFTGANGSAGRSISTIGVTQGKWYAEFKIKNTHKSRIGIIDEIGYARNNADNDGVDYDTPNGIIYTYLNGTDNDTGDNSSSSGVDVTNPSADDILGVALDADNEKVRFFLNGSALTSDGDGFTPLQRTGQGLFKFFHIRDGSGSGDDEPNIICNFGNPPYAVSSSNTDGKYGNFEYAPPSGFYALCTKRLAEFG